MAPKPPSSDEPKPAAAGDPVAPELAKKAAKPPEPDIEIDDDPLLSPAEGEGLWVQAWVWVPELSTDDDEQETLE